MDLLLINISHCEHLRFTVHCSVMWLLLFYVFTILHVFVVCKCLQDSFKLEFVFLSSFSLLFGGDFWEEKYAEVPLLCHLSGNQPLLLETLSFLGFGDPTVFRFLFCLFLLCNVYLPTSFRRKVLGYLLTPSLYFYPSCSNSFT